MKFKKYVILLLLIVLLSINFSVYAATGDSYKISLSANKTSLKVEETVTLALKTSNINIQSGEKGIGSYEGTISYDTDVFEEIKMKGNDLWDTPSLNQGKFTSVRSDGQCTNENQEIATITLKVKKDAKSGDTKIKITNFEASNGIENIANEGTEITLKIEKAQETTNNKDNTSPTSTNGNNSKNSTSSQTGNLKSANSTKNTLPRTGISGTILIAIAILIIIAILCYFKYKRSY